MKITNLTKGVEVSAEIVKNKKYLLKELLEAVIMEADDGDICEIEF